MMTNSKVENMEEALNPLVGRLKDGVEGDTNDPVTVVVIFSTIIAVLGSYVFGSAVGYSSPAQSGIVNDLGLSLADYSLFGSILTIGAMVGAITSGKIADSFGRRSAMGFSELFCLLGWIAIAFSKTAWLLDIGRLSIGYGIGTLSYAVPIYIAEITPKNVRGVFTALNQMMICFGVSVMYLVGTLTSWRILALIGIVPGILQLLGLFFIPESPRWLAKTRSWTDCETSLQRLRGENADISKEAAEIKEYTESLRDFPSSEMTDLFQRKYRQALLIGVGLMVLQQFGGVNAIAYYASSIFETAGMRGSFSLINVTLRSFIVNISVFLTLHLSVITGFSGRIGSTAMVVVQVPTTVVGTFLTDRCGRRPLLLVSSAGTCLGSFLIGMSFLLQDLQQLQISPILALVGVLIFTGSFSIGMGGIPWVIMSEIFPINVKGMAASLVIVVNWLGSWIVSYSFNFLLELSSQGTFFLFASISALTIIFVAKLVPETKGRTLEEIQASMVLLG